MSDFTKLQKDKILNYLYKKFKKIDFDNIDNWTWRDPSIYKNTIINTNKCKNNMR